MLAFSVVFSAGISERELQTGVLKLLLCVFELLDLLSEHVMHSLELSYRLFVLFRSLVVCSFPPPQSLLAFIVTQSLPSCLPALL